MAGSRFPSTRSQSQWLDFKPPVARFLATCKNSRFFDWWLVNTSVPRIQNAAHQTESRGSAQVAFRAPGKLIPFGGEEVQDCGGGTVRAAPQPIRTEAVRPTDGASAPYAPTPGGGAAPVQQAFPSTLPSRSCRIHGKPRFPVFLGHRLRLAKKSGPVAFDGAALDKADPLTVSDLPSQAVGGHREREAVTSTFPRWFGQWDLAKPPCFLARVVCGSENTLSRALKLYQVPGAERRGLVTYSE